MTEILLTPPASETWGYVSAEVMRSRGDTVGDSGDTPDYLPQLGTVTFTPARSWDALTDALVVRDTVTSIIDPATGQLTMAGVVGPVKLWVGEWTASFALDSEPGEPVRVIPPITFTLTASHTFGSPLKLSAAAPVTPPATTILQALAVPALVEGNVLTVVDGQLAWTAGFGTGLDNNVAGYIKSASATQAAGDARWVVKSEAPRNLRSYAGADPTGVTDSTAAVQAFLNDLNTNGGAGIAHGTFRTSTLLSIAGASGKPFTFDGLGATAFISRNTSASSFMNLNAATNVTLKGFTIDAGRAETGFSSHGIAAVDCTGCTLDSIGVTNWLNTALMFYKSTSGTSIDNHIIRPRVDGGGAANNGVMLESTLRGSIVGASVYNLGRTGSPGYGIQLKNASQYCRVEGGYVENALAGVSFGQDSGTGPSMNLVSDVIVYNCREGLTGGAASNNVVTMRIDMAAAADINQAIRLVLGCTGNDVRAQVDNVTSPKAVVRIDTGSDNRIHVTHVNGVDRPKMYEVLGATSTRNQFRVGTVVGYTGTPFTSSTDAGTGNVAVYEGP